MRHKVDFLLFKTFISTKALIFFYYFGAIFIPLFVYFSKDWLVKNIYFIKKIKEIVKNISTKRKIIFILLFIISFLFAELLWRMMFEFLIAYMQMRDSLVN